MLRFEKITIPDSGTEISSYIFRHCDNLKGNLFDNAYYMGNKENPYFVLIKAKDYDITNCEIHKNTAYIIEDAFRFCECLTELAMPDGLISIKGYAFMSCTQLKHIILPKSIKNIGSHAFYHCNNIKKVYYTGTIKDLSNNPLSEYKFRPFNKLYYYSEKKPITKGKFWHYDEEMKSIIEW
ncbi:MAG: leucine-rich repeat domain-containing protein [Bacilli bacterium]